MHGLPAMLLQERLDTVTMPGLRLEDGTLSWVFVCPGTPDGVLTSIAQTTGAARSACGIAGPLRTDRCLLAVSCAPDLSRRPTAPHAPVDTSVDPIEAELIAILEGTSTPEPGVAWTLVKAIACDPAALMSETWSNERSVPSAAAYRALAGVAVACGVPLPTEVFTASIDLTRQRGGRQRWWNARHRQS